MDPRINIVIHQTLMNKEIFRSKSLVVEDEVELADADILLYEDLKKE